MKHITNYYIATIYERKGRQYIALVDRYSNGQYEVISCPTNPQLRGQKVDARKVGDKKRFGKSVKVEYVASSREPSQQTLIDTVQTYKFVGDSYEEVAHWGEPIWIIVNADDMAIACGYVDHQIWITE